MSPIIAVSHGTRPQGDSRNIPDGILTVGDISPIPFNVDPLLDDIAAFIEAHGLSERKFGELALNDKNFVSDMRERGRSPSLNTVERIRRFMVTYKPAPQADAA